MGLPWLCGEAGAYLPRHSELGFQALVCVREFPKIEVVLCLAPRRPTRATRQSTNLDYKARLASVLLAELQTQDEVFIDALVEMKVLYELPPPPPPPWFHP